MQSHDVGLQRTTGSNAVEQMGNLFATCHLHALLRIRGQVVFGRNARESLDAARDNAPDQPTYVSLRSLCTVIADFVVGGHGAQMRYRILRNVGSRFSGRSANARIFANSYRPDLADWNRLRTKVARRDAIVESGS